jgi:hypothetical protein
MADVGFGYFLLTPYRPPLVPNLLAAMVPCALFLLAQWLRTPVAWPGPVGLSGTLRSWLTRPVTTTAFFAISWGVRHTGLAPVLAMPLVVALCACAGWPVRRVAATGEGLPTSTSWRWHPARLASQSCLPLFRNSAGQHYGDDSCRAGTPCVVALGLPAPQQEDGPMTDVTIRPYRPADLEACRALWAEPPQRHRDL